MRRRRHNSEAGVVLIAALGGIVILTMIAFALASSVRVGADELQIRKEHLQAYYLARGGIFRTALLLSQMSPAPDSILHPGQRKVAWEKSAGEIEVEITDESGKIDVNQAQKPLLEKLFLALGYDLDVARPLATAVVDWRNPSSLARWESAQASGNLLEYDPLHSTKVRYGAIEELLNVPGMKPEIFYGRYVRKDDGKIERLPGLAECVTVDSGILPVNINYAPYPVLLAATDMNARAAEAIIAGRDRKPFAAVQDITREFPASLSHEALSMLTTQGSGRFSLLATGKTPRGIVARIHAVVMMEQAANGPFQVVRWKDSYVP